VSRSQSVDYQLESDERVYEGIVTSVAVLEDAEPTALPPLYVAVDTDALEALFGERAEGGLSMTFEYAGYDIRLGPERTVTVTEKR
jgi:hypothetical protein